MKACHAKTMLTTEGSLRLAQHYNHLGVPPSLLLELACIEDLDTHAAKFLAWWGQQPKAGTDALPPEVVSLLNGDSWFRSIGLKLYSLFTYGTGGCQCCAGWRIALMFFALPALGYWLR